jgi:hypothetical protein
VVGALLLDDGDEEGCRWARGTAEDVLVAPTCPCCRLRSCVSYVLHLTASVE